MQQTLRKQEQISLFGSVLFVFLLESELSLGALQRPKPGARTPQVSRVVKTKTKQEETAEPGFQGGTILLRTGGGEEEAERTDRIKEEERNKDGKHRNEHTSYVNYTVIERDLHSCQIVPSHESGPNSICC